ncbi:aldose 1-epimerase [Flavobacteriaceae bacterium MAR_2010_72]|nr:aldose 1-epimerase [Flavobacteriaceae bacterium MAR_2010_72]
MEKNAFKLEMEGQQIYGYQLINKHGLKAFFTNFGQRLVSLFVPDKSGDFEDIVLGYNNIEGYLNSKEPYFGAIIGRYANRIAKGEFTIDSKKYILHQNNGPNHLHGGTQGFHNIVWDAKQISNTEIEFSRISQHLEEGYPGNLTVRVNYKLTDDNELHIKYFATTDQTTTINLTHHSYFNLAGEGNGTINDHQLLINANNYTPVDKTLIPTGEIAPVKDSAFDFTIVKDIGKDIDNLDEQLKFGEGYDHNYVLNKSNSSSKEVSFAARVRHPKSGRTMEVFTDEPGIQLYSGNSLDGSVIGKNGKFYQFRSAFCLEPQHFPDAPNQSHFPSIILKENDTYTSTTILKFTISQV